MSCLFYLKEVYLKTIPINDDELHNALCVNLSRKQWSFLLAGIDDLHSLLTIGLHVLTRVSFAYLCKHMSIICLHVWVKLTNVMTSFGSKMVCGKYPSKAVNLQCMYASHVSSKIKEVHLHSKLDAVIKTVIPARMCLPLNMKHPVTL